MFEDLVSVYRNFLGQRSGSVSQSIVFLPRFLFPLSYFYPLFFFIFVRWFFTPFVSLYLDRVDLPAARIPVSPPSSFGKVAPRTKFFFFILLISFVFLIRRYDSRFIGVSLTRV